MTENRVYRIILGAASYTPIVALRGEVGASDMESRLIKDRLLFTKNMLESDNSLVKTTIEKVMSDGGSSWKKKTDEYLRMVGLSMEELQTINKNGIKKRIYEYDSRKWTEELRTKSSLEIYRECKTEVKEEKFYKNGEVSRLIFRARSNTMALNDRFRHDRGENRRDTDCGICGTEMETLEHFVLRCGRLEGERDSGLLREMRGTDDRDTMSNLLFKGGMIMRAGEMIKKMWGKRKYLINRMGR